MSYYTFFIDVPVSQLSDKLYKKMYSLNLRSKGRMRPLLVQSRRNISFGSTFYALDGNKLVAWALVSNSSLKGEKNYIQVFVRSQYRKMGLASILIYSAYGAYGILNFVPYDIASNKLMDKFSGKIKEGYLAGLYDVRYI